MEAFIVQSLPYACAIALLGFLCLIGCVLYEAKRNDVPTVPANSMVLAVHLVERDAKVFITVKTLSDAQFILNCFMFSSVAAATVINDHEQEVVAIMSNNGVLS